MNLNDWLNLALRWVHLIAGIAWIGSSFYFIWLDSHLKAPEKPRDDVTGELWMVHSGGFYQVERRLVGPGRMPKTLHWFKWEAAITWISGMLLLGVVYYLTRGLFLVDPLVAKLTPGIAIALGLGTVLLSWPVYDAIWESPLAGRASGKKGKPDQGTEASPVVASSVSGSSTPAILASVVLLAAVAWGLCHALSGRAAFLHVGALLGTLMTANVWLRILPAQQKMIDATKLGRAPDFTLGERAKQRSVHNSYMTFPVLFLMLSNHFPAVYAARSNWVVLLLLIFVGAVARHLMIGKGRSRGWVLAPTAAAVAAVVMLSSPSSMPGATPNAGRSPGAGTGSHVPFSRVQAVVLARCSSCHSENPPVTTFGPAPGGVSFDRPEEIIRLADRIRVRAVTTKTMPLGNMTAMTQAERDLVADWLAQGARDN
jgi:uncharacterized membrane protein